MDHCEALRNAPQAGGTVSVEVRVVDCIVHVERNLIIHQNLLVARGAADEEEEKEDDEEEGEETKGHKKKKKVPFLDAAREDAKMLSAITDREIFERVVEVVLAYWRYHQQDAFADGFESVYLCDAWDNGAFLLEPATDPVSTHTAIRHRRSVDAPPIRVMALERDEDLLRRSPITARIHHHCAYYSKSKVSELLCYE
jgi:hypothetical protein